MGLGQRDGVGDTFDAKTASGKVLTYTVTGTFTDDTDFIGDYAASDVNAAAYGEANDVTNIFVSLAPGANSAAVRRRSTSGSAPTSRP